ncbi:MAG: class I SAM-dependent methyltransferase [candidate division Zixibacteria bacterium]|nr:class I SAM-dependent methyltransferase [candidate division Zixibacteria bacterium]
MSETVSLDIQAVLSRYLTPEQIDRYYEQVMKQNRQVNLVSRETKRVDFDRLVAESLLPLGFLPSGMNGYLDIGSGGGFPSVPILMSGAVDGDCTLVERTGKKARALEQILTGLTLSASVTALNFHEIREIGSVELVTLRYVKLSESLLSKIMSSLAPSGKFVYYSTPGFDTGDMLSTIFKYQSPQDAVIKSFTVFSK